MIYHDVEQSSEEWFRLRLGTATASCFDRILTPAKGDPSSQARKYIAELIGEQMATFLPANAPNFTSRAMDWGQQTEAEARRFYGMERDIDVQQVGGCLTDDGKLWCSPDGLIGEDGGCEIKSPLPKTHAKYLLKPGSLLDDYKQQIHGALIVTGRAWWEILSYSLGLPPVLIRVEPSKDTDLLRVALDDFCDRYATALAKVRGT